MTNKALRTLIADTQHARVRIIEKMLNCLGYYCVASVGSYEDLVALTTPPVHCFDLLIVDSLLASYQGINMPAFCQFNPQVYHSLIYGNCSVKISQTAKHQAVHASMMQVPDIQSIKDFMALIDSSALSSKVY